MRLLLLTFLIALIIFPVADKAHSVSSRQKICESSDIEDGSQYFVSGVTTIKLNGEITDTKRDVCDSDEILIEYSCDPTNHTIIERRFPCRQGCSEDKCTTSAPIISEASDVQEEETIEDSTVQEDTTAPDSGADDVAEEEDDGGIMGFLKGLWEKARSLMERFFLWAALLFEGSDRSI
jgi:hypothetical protein